MIAGTLGATVVIIAAIGFFAVVGIRGGDPCAEQRKLRDRYVAPPEFRLVGVEEYCGRCLSWMCGGSGVHEIWVTYTADMDGDRKCSLLRDSLRRSFPELTQTGQLMTASGCPTQLASGNHIVVWGLVTAEPDPPGAGRGEISLQFEAT